jgi:hypothetical protein
MKELLKNLTMYHSGWNNIHIFYLHEDILDNDEIDDAYAWIQIHVDDIINIHYLKTRGDVRGNGLARYLIFYSLYYFNNINVIELDDMSNNYGKRRNIYTTMGFKYIEDDQPEMIGYRNDIIKYYDAFRKKYNNTKYFK